MKFNRKYFNVSAWITVIITFVLPYQSQSSDGFSTYFGYPLAFLTVYDNSVGKTLMTSTHTNILVFLIDIFIIYFIILFSKFYLECLFITNLKTKIVKIRFNK